MRRPVFGVQDLASKVDFLDTAHGRDFRRFATYSGMVQQIQALDQKRLALHGNEYPGMGFCPEGAAYNSPG
jgi:hypothetical protein